MGYSIVKIEGIGPTYAEKLEAAGIRSTDGFLKHCADKKGRRHVAEKTGVSEGHLLKWANMADLMRIQGIGPQFGELLEAAGVDTVKELRNRKADNLAQKLAEVQQAKRLTRVSPSEAQVKAWIEEAKSLPPVISH